MVEDDPDILSQTLACFAGEPDFSCVGAFAYAEHLIANMDAIRPDVVLLSIGLPGQDGLSCLRQLKPHYPAVHFVLYTAHDSYSREARAAGASAYFVKPELPADLIAGVREVVRGGA